MRYRLRTLVILLALGPMMLAGLWIAAQSPGFMEFAIGVGVTGVPAIGALLWSAIDL